MNCSIKTIISKDVFVQTKSIFRVNQTIRWMTTVFDSSQRLLGGARSELLAYIENPANIGYIHLNRCLEISNKLYELNNKRI